MSSDKTYLRQCLEYELGRPLDHELQDWEGPSIRQEITRAHMKKCKMIGRRNLKTVAARCAGAVAVEDAVPECKAAAVGNSRVMMYMKDDTLQYAEFYGPEVHIRFDSKRSPVGAQFTVKPLRRSPPRDDEPHDPKEYPNRGNRRGAVISSKRAQILKKAFGR